jgi:nitronate monooxygenase
MPIPSLFKGRLALPLIGAPMFIVSYPELVHAQCAAGVAGCFPSLNARDVATLDGWLDDLTRRLGDLAAADPARPVAPFGVNLIVHRSNTRLEEDLALVSRYKVPLIITSVGAPTQVVERVHAYGGIVLHDVTNLKHARKALETGVDGLILVAAGAGGHAGTLSPFALLSELREFYDGPLVLSGALSSGAAVRAAEVMGADLGYMGTRFVATREAHAVDPYKQMIVEGCAGEVVYTPAFSGVPANYLRASIAACGLDPDNILVAKEKGDLDLLGEAKKIKPWKDVWSAGHGIGTIHDVPAVADLVARLVREYRQAVDLPAFDRR